MRAFPKEAGWLHASLNCAKNLSIGDTPAPDAGSCFAFWPPLQKVLLKKYGAIGF